MKIQSLPIYITVILLFTVFLSGILPLEAAEEGRIVIFFVFDKKLTRQKQIENETLRILEKAFQGNSEMINGRGIKAGKPDVRELDYNVKEEKKYGMDKLRVYDNELPSLVISSYPRSGEPDVIGKYRLNTGLWQKYDTFFKKLRDKSSWFVLDSALGECEIATVPEKVRIMIDGNYAGISPVTLKDIIPGSHVLSFVPGEESGFEEEEYNLKIDYFERKKVSLCLKEKKSFYLWMSPQECLLYSLRPSSLAFDSGGNIYLLDTSGNQIVKFSGTRKLLGKWGEKGREENDLFEPGSLCLDLDKNLLVCDTKNHRIKKYSPKGSVIKVWGSYGSKAGQFNEPRGICVDGGGRVYVADTRNQRIQVFDKDGKFIKSLGKYGSASGQFNNPMGLITDNEGNLFVADSRNSRIQKFDNQGEFVTQWKTCSLNNDELKEPASLCLDSSNNLIVLDVFRKELFRFNRDGRFISKITVVDSREKEGFNPVNLSADASGSLYVTDAGKQCVYKLPGKMDSK